MSDTATIETPPPVPPAVPVPFRRAPAVVFGVTSVAFLICAAIFALPVPGRPSRPAFARSIGGAASLRGVAAAGSVSPGMVTPAPSAPAIASPEPPSAPSKPGPPPAKAVPAPSTATIAVTGLAASAQVRVDGQRYTARTITVPAGRHVLSVVVAGAVRGTDSVRLRVGETYTWSPVLKALPPPSATPPRSASSSRATGPTCRGMIESGRWDDAVTLCTKEAAAGKASAQRDLGELFERGRGVSRSEGEAAKWYTKAGESGDRDAMLRIAVACEKGRGVKKDGSAALGWYTRAANAGLADAQYAVGQAYERGKLGARKDKTMALEWYRKAAAQGHQDAIARMKDLSR